jgi:hypothetical protein
MTTLYYPKAKELFERSPILAKHGFGTGSVETWGKGADFNDLLQIKKPSWRLLATDGERIGYKGVEVHWESCRPGHWVLHCELWPRLGKKEKEAVKSIDDLLTLKGGLTELLRERGKAAGWESELGAHLLRARSDSKDPSSLIVYTFELGLAAGHSAETFVERALRVVDRATPTIDDIVIEG